MSNIDWDTAPEGFPLWLEAKHKGCSGFVRDDGDRYRYPDMSYYTKAEEGSLFSIHHQISWDGEGLPPVGTVCEAWYDDGRVCWHQADVVGHNPYEPNTIAVSLKGDHERKLIWSDHFRPLPSPEQIAAEEREKAIEALAVELAGHWSSEAVSLQRETAAYLHDIGYRRVEQ